MKIKYFFYFIISLDLLYANEATSLYQLSKKAINQNAKIQSLNLQIKAKKKSVDQARDRLFPTISISGYIGYDKYEYKYPDHSQGYKNKVKSYDLEVRQPIYRPKLIKEINDAKIHTNIAKLQKDYEISNILLDLSKAYISCILAENKKNLNIEKINVLNDLYRLITERQKLGLSDKVELLSAISKLSKAKSEFRQSQQNLLYFKNKLRYVLNDPYLTIEINNRKFSLDNILDMFPRSKYSFYEKKINENKKIKIAKEYLKLAKNEIKKRKAEYFPTIDFIASYSDTDSSDSITRRNNFKAIMQIKYDLFKSGFRKDNIAEALYLYQAAEKDWQNVINEVKISFEEDWQNIQVSKTLILSDIDALNSSRIYFKSVKEGYEKGVKELTEVYKAQNQYYEAQLALLQDQYSYLKSILSLYNDIGFINIKKLKELEKTFIQ